MKLEKCKECDPKNVVETKSGDLVCTKCKVVVGKSEKFLPELEKDKKGDLIARMPDFVEFKDLDKKEKFKSTIAKDIEDLLRAIPFEVNTTGIAQSLVKEMHTLTSEKDRLTKLGAILYLTYILSDGRNAAETKKNMIKRIKTLSGEAKKKNFGDYEKAFDAIVKELEDSDKFKTMKKNMEENKRRQKKFLESKRKEAGEKKNIINEESVLKSLRMVLGKKSLDGLKREAKKLNIKEGTKDEMMKDIIAYRMARLKVIPIEGITKTIKFESYENELKKMSMKDLISIAKNVDSPAPITNVGERSRENLIKILAAAKMANSKTNKARDVTMANELFNYMNRIRTAGSVNDSSKSIGTPSKEKEKGKKEDGREYEVMKNINERQKMKRRPTVRVDFDEKGNMVLLPGQKEYKLKDIDRVIVEKTDHREKFRISDIKPTNLKQLQRKLQLVEEALEDEGREIPYKLSKKEIEKIDEMEKEEKRQRDLLEKERISKNPTRFVKMGGVTRVVGALPKKQEEGPKKDIAAMNMEELAFAITDVDLKKLAEKIKKITRAQTMRFILDNKINIKDISKKTNKQLLGELAKKGIDLEKVADLVVRDTEKEKKITMEDIDNFLESQPQMKKLVKITGPKNKTKMINALLNIGVSLDEIK